MANADLNGGGRGAADIVSCRFEPLTESVAAARHFVVDRAHLAGRSAEEAALVASELAANAVLHAGTAFEVSMRADGDLLTIAVADGDPALPISDRASSADPAGSLPPAPAVSGRGLFIVSSVAERVGAHATSTGKAVWAELRIHPGDQHGPLA